MLSKTVLYELLLSLCCVLFVGLRCQELPRNCSRNQFDADLSQILGLFGVKGVNFPTNDEEMDSYCNVARQGEQLSLSFRDSCLTGYPKTVMYTFSNSLKSFLNQFCGENPTKRQEFIDWSECGNKGKNGGTTHCWNRLLTNLYKSRYMEEPDDRVPAMCCNFLSWRTCTLNVLKGVDACDEDIIDGYDTQIKKISMDPLQVLCDEYFEEPLMCISILEEMPHFDVSRRRRVDTKTPLLAIFKIFESLH